MANTCEHGLKKSECYVCMSPKKGARMSDIVNYEKILSDRINKLQTERNRLLVLAIKWCDKTHHDWDEICGFNIAGIDLDNNKNRERCLADKDWRDEMLQDQGLDND